jgi:hypothetical protein
MSEEDAGAIYGKVAMVCGFCGSREELPAEPSERVVALRQRLQQIAWTAREAEAPALSAARTLEMWKSMVLPAAVVLLVVPILVAVSQIMSREHLDLAGVLSVSLTPFFGVAVVCGVQLGSFLALRSYQRELAPALLAFAPSSPDGAVRCRTCGGELPSIARKAFVTCGFCGSQNLVTPELAKRNEADLDRELEIHRARAAGMTSRVTTAHAKLRKRMTIAAIAGAGFACAVSFFGFAIVQIISGA